MFLVDRSDGFAGESVGAAPELSGSDVALVYSASQGVEDLMGVLSPCARK